jgi:hypothetical protein
MKTIIITLSLLASLQLKSQNCDCSIIPWTPKPCYDICSIKFFSTATQKQVKDSLKITDNLSKKIKTTVETKNITKIEDFQAHLSTDEYNILNSKLGSFRKRVD